MIRTQQLGKSFGDAWALQDLNLEVKKGEIFGFLGPNGAGKTTTIRILVGLLRPTTGSAWVGGYDIARQALKARQVIGYMAQEPFIYSKLTGREHLRFVGGLYGLSDGQVEARARELLGLLDLTEYIDRLTDIYSGGMRRKLGLCAAMLHQPAVLILDEPLSGLDPASSRRIKDLLRHLCSQGATVFMSTHVLETVEQMCDRVAILDRGYLISIGSVAELRRQLHAAKNTSLEDLFLQLTENGTTTAMPPIHGG